MKQYKVFVNSSHEYEAVKQGWSWPAFFFGVIWLFIKKMWGLGLVVLATSFIVSVLLVVSGMSEQEGNALGSFVTLVIGIVLGVNGNELRESNLVARGFGLVDHVDASNPKEAISLAVQGLQGQSATDANATLVN